jgi:hypothetical protein
MEAVLKNGNGIGIAGVPYLYGGTNPPYTFSAGSGPYTRVINLTPAMLTGHRLSFWVQDDTKVISAKIDISYCCVDPE